MPIMKNDAIDNKIFSTILDICKKNNRADIDSIYEQIIKTIDFEDVTKEILDDRIHTLINDEKITNKRNRNADSYYLNTELVDTGALELLFPSQELLKSVPTILIPDPLNDSSLLNKMAPEEVLENLHVEMIALKSFVVDQIYVTQKKIKIL